MFPPYLASMLHPPDPIRWSLRSAWVRLLIQSVEKAPQCINIRDDADKPLGSVDYRDPTDLVFDQELHGIAQIVRREDKRISRHDIAGSRV
jgi:hypothetical protein